MSKNEKTKFSTKRIAVDALLIAVEFVLSKLATDYMTYGGVKVSFAVLPILLCAILYGPIDAMIVAFFGEFLTQMLSTQYGITPTSLLWCLPETIRALILGFALLWVRKTLLVKQPRSRYILFYAICIFTALITAVFTTAVYYLDSKMFGYYNYHLIFGVLWIRLVVGTAIAVLTASIVLLLARRLRAARLA